MAELATSVFDLVTIKMILEGYKSEGIENPLLPMNVDIDGDGIADAYGLDDNGEVCIVSGVDLKDTVYVSDGDDVRAVPGVG